VALNPVLPSRKVLSFPVPTRKVRDVIFSVCPSAQCAYAANAVGKDLDIFAF
jgi:hypothetical protein